MAQGGIWAYCRVSTAKSEQELSLEEQERWARTFAHEVGRELQIFRERASAKSTLGRPVFQNMIAGLQETPITKRPKQVVVTSLDRLSRDMTDTLLVARTLRELKIELYVRDVGVIRAETFAQRAALVGQSMGGEAENEARSNRMKASWRRRRDEGKPTSNKVPYGLQMLSERDVAAADSSDWVKSAFEWYASGIGTHTIAERFKKAAPLHVARVPKLDAEGKPVVRIRRPVWEYNRIIKLLRQPRYRGTIVTPELFDRVQSLLASKPRWRQTRHSEYPLSGAVKCKTCGRSFHGHSTSDTRATNAANGNGTAYKNRKRWRYYSCTVCGVRINAETLEQMFREQVDKLVADERLLKKWVAGEHPDVRKAEARREITTLERSTSPEAVEAARSRIWDLALGGSYASADLNAQLERLSTKITADRERLQALKITLEAREDSRRSVEKAQELLSGFWRRYDRAKYEDKRALMAALTGALGGVCADRDGLYWNALSNTQATQLR